MLIGTAEEYIEIQQTRLSIKTINMSGTTWIYWNETNFDQFIKDLQQLEKTRQGKAKLRHLSYESEFRPFHLEIFSIDRLGHMAIYVEVNNTHYTQYRSYRHSLSVEFEIDVEKFAIITKEFLSLNK